MREVMALAVLCLLVALASFLCLIWALLRGRMLGMDDLLLMAICLVLGAIFSLNLAWLVLKTPLKEALRSTLEPLLKLRARVASGPRPAEASQTSPPGSPTPS